MRVQERVIVPLKIEYGFGVCYNRIPIYPIFYLLKGDYILTDHAGQDFVALMACQSQRVHVGIWYILRAQRGCHIPTLRPKYTPYSYMDPLGMWNQVTR